MANITKFSKTMAGTMTWGRWGKQLGKDGMTRLIKHCLEVGITTFDHADIHGGYTTEAEFGNAFSKSGIPRVAIQPIPKCGIQLISGNCTTGYCKSIQLIHGTNKQATHSRGLIHFVGNRPWASFT